MGRMLSMRPGPHACLLCVVLFGCGAAIPSSAGLPEGSASCSGGLRTAQRVDIGDLAPVPDGVVSRVALRGLRTVSEELVRSVLGEREGRPIDLDGVRQDLVAILALEVFEDVRAIVEPDPPASVSLIYELVERPLVSGVVVRGSVLPEHVFERPRAGEVYEPEAIHRAAQRLAIQHRLRGYDRAVARAHAQRRGNGVEVCLDVRPGPRRLIASFTIEGNEQVTGDELRERIRTHGGRVNTIGGAYQPQTLIDDQTSWMLLFYERGLLTAHVHDPEAEMRSDGLHVRVRIEEGPRFRLGRVSIEGDLRADRARYEAAFFPRSGEIFVRSRVAEGVAALYALEEELGRGRDAVEIRPTTDMRVDEGIIHLTLEVHAVSASEVE